MKCSVDEEEMKRSKQAKRMGRSKTNDDGIMGHLHKNRLGTHPERIIQIEWRRQRFAFFSHSDPSGNG
jgi:hypothetical protein